VVGPPDAVEVDLWSSERLQARWTSLVCQSRTREGVSTGRTRRWSASSGVSAPRGCASRARWGLYDGVEVELSGPARSTRLVRCESVDLTGCHRLGASNTAGDRASREREGWERLKLESHLIGSEVIISRPARSTP
jgi:hypothetical protein